MKRLNAFFVLFVQSPLLGGISFVLILSRVKEYLNPCYCDLNFLFLDSLMLAIYCDKLQLVNRHIFLLDMSFFHGIIG